MVLVDTEIAEEVKTRNLIIDFSTHCLEGASYDMRLGSQYSQNNNICTIENGSCVKIEPGEFLLLSSLEMLNLPLDLIGHNGIMSRWAKKGLVSLFSPQIDPGFHGILIVPVFNAGSAPVSISVEDKFFTIEFVKCNSSASYGWSERNNLQSAIISPESPNNVGPSLKDITEIYNQHKSLKKNINNLEMRLKHTENKTDILITNRGFTFSNIARWLAIISMGILVVINLEKIKKTLALIPDLLK